MFGGLKRRGGRCEMRHAKSEKVLYGEDVVEMWWRQVSVFFFFFFESAFIFPRRVTTGYRAVT